MAYKVDHEIEMELTVNYFTMHSDVQPAILRVFTARTFSVIGAILGVGCATTRLLWLLEYKYLSKKENELIVERKKVQQYSKSNRVNLTSSLADTNG